MLSQAASPHTYPSSYMRCSNAWMSLPGGAFELFRIGDAVSDRGTHVAISGALRLVKGV